MTHTSYEIMMKRPCDFIVKYRFYTATEGGRTSPPGQGYRSDFLYDGESVDKGLWMIHPEFLDDKGNVIESMETAIPQTGMAKMWILNNNFFEFHKAKINIGQKGYFMEGPRKTAECEVIELVRLKKDKP